MITIRFDNIIKVSSNKIYAGMHWRNRAKMKENYKLLLYNDLIKIKPIKHKVNLDFKFYWKGKALDSSNCSYMAKMIEDCLVERKILSNDSIKEVGEISMESLKAGKNENDYCILEINSY